LALRKSVRPRYPQCCTDLDAQSLYKFTYPVVTIPGIVSLGPKTNIKAVGSIGLEGALNVTAGFDVYFSLLSGGGR
jgi:hypothetical protein